MAVRHLALRARRLGAATLGLVALSALALSVSPAGVAADPGLATLRSCMSRGGTLVAVDFAHWGGPIVRGCATRQADGFALMHAAGFTTAGDAQDGSTFVCRIGNAAFAAGAQYPTAEQERCLQTPPDSAYWSYWLAPAGQNHWTYSQLGPQGDRPKPGEIELWMFGSTTLSGQGGTGVPHFSPASLRVAPNAPPATQRTAPPRAPTTGPAPAPTPPPHRATTHPHRAASKPHPARRASSHPAAPTRTTPHRPARPHHPAHGSAATTASPTAAGTRPAAQSTPRTPLVTAQPARATVARSSATPLLVALGLLALLAGGAARVARRRRHLE